MGIKQDRSVFKPVIHTLGPSVSSKKYLMLWWTEKKWQSGAGCFSQQGWFYTRWKVHLLRTLTGSVSGAWTPPPLILLCVLQWFVSLFYQRETDMHAAAWGGAFHSRGVEYTIYSNLFGGSEKVFPLPHLLLWFLKEASSSCFPILSWLNESSLDS